MFSQSLPDDEVNSHCESSCAAAPISAAGTGINCPEAVPGAEATAVCLAVSISDSIDSTMLVHGCWHVCYEKDIFHCPQPLPCLLVLFRLKFIGLPFLLY